MVGLIFPDFFIRLASSLNKFQPFTTSMLKNAVKNIATIAASLGVRRAVIAPGSRNTPLTLALTAHPDIACYPVTDERSAGFFALGMAQYSGEPVVLVCTSGSAVLNFAPAVAEAYYQNLPLIVLTADRPAEWIDQSDGQTIRQQNVFANYIKASFQLPADDVIFSDRTVAQAIDQALQFPRGPVHLNVPLSEPLYVDMPEDSPAPRIFRTLSSEAVPSSETAAAFCSSFYKAQQKMIVVGTGKKDEALNQLLNDLATQTDTLIVAENLSNISGAAIITTPDLFFSSLTEEEKKALQPDMLITIGHSVVSKQLKTYLRAYQPAEHWQFQSELPYADTYRSLTHILPVKGETMLKLLDVSNELKDSCRALSGIAKELQGSNQELNEATKKLKGSYRQLIDAVSERTRIRKEAFIQQLPPCDIALFRELLPVIPSQWVVQLANSTPVRIVQFFESRSDLEYFCNRGTSGIDGSVATSAGSALASGLPTVLISGDLSFLYDSNGLWNANFPPKLKIIVLNNDGANIFSMIGDQKVIERCQPFFDARHSVNIEALCRAFGINYKKLEWQKSQKDVRGILLDFLQQPGAAVLEVPTDRAVNVSTYKELFTALRSKM